MRHIAFLTFILTLLHCPNSFANIISPVGFPTGIAEAIPAQASRTEGVAPLSVFFNAQLKPSSSTERSFHNYEYSWDFGDPDSGTWGTTGAPKNTDKGPVAAHVYETPGTYIVTLTVKDGASGSELPDLSKTFVITVTDPDIVFSGTLTTCISNTTDFVGCPSGARKITTNDLSILPAYSNAGERVLLHRGSSWNVPEGVYPRRSSAGPVHIGAYGTCSNPDSLGICNNAPRVNVTFTDGSYQFLDLYRKHDWRLTDITFTANSSTVSSVISGSTDIQNFLALRVKASNFPQTPLGWGHWREKDGDIIKNNGVVSCSAPGGSTMLLYIGGERVFAMGNSLHDSSTTHISRIWHAYGGVISHNLISGASLDNTNGRHAIKLHGPKNGSEVGTYAETGGYGIDNRTTFVVVSDNIFGGSGPWPVSIGPQDSISEEDLSDILFEKNKVIAGYGSQSPTPVQVSLMIEGRYITARNNIIDGTGGSNDYTGINVNRRGIEWTPLAIRVYNNTIFNSGSIPNGAKGITVGEEATNTIIRNNYVSFPNETIEKLTIDDSGNSIISNNAITDTPGFLDSNNTDLLKRNFSLTSEAIDAIDKGYFLPILDDFSNASRTGIFDIGAYSY